MPNIQNRRALSGRALLALVLFGLTATVFAELTCVEGDCINGMGKAIGPGNHPQLKSREYEGGWRDGKFNGQGKYTWVQTDGLSQTYEGMWRNGSQDGLGETRYPDNSSEIGWYSDGKFFGDNVCVKGNCTDGEGFHASYFRGLYQGSFKAGKRHGNGISVSPSGSQYVGEWAEDKPNGQGSYEYDGGKKYDGEWVAAKKHGQGRLIHANGQVEEGIWENDVLVLTQSEINLLAQRMDSRKSECTSYGFQPESDGHANCVMNLAISERNRLKDKRIAAHQAREQEESDARWAAYRQRLQASAEQKRDAAYARLEAESAAVAAASAKDEIRQRQANALIDLGSAISGGASSDRPISSQATSPLSSGRFKTCRYRVAGEIVTTAVGRAEACDSTKIIGGQTGYLIR